MCIYFIIIIIIIIIIIRDVSVFSLTAGAEKGLVQTGRKCWRFTRRGLFLLLCKITSCHWQSVFEQVYNCNKDHCHTYLHNLCCLDIFVKSIEVKIQESFIKSINCLGIAVKRPKKLFKVGGFMESWKMAAWSSSRQVNPWMIWWWKVVESNFEWKLSRFA